VSRALRRVGAVFVDIDDDTWAADLDTPDDVARFRHA
jgi:hypothetical protein